MSKEYKHPHLKLPEGGNGAYCPMEPEKKDVWDIKAPVDYDKNEQKCFWRGVETFRSGLMENVLNPDQVAERIVIEYANISGRESENRTYVREASRKVLQDLLDLLTQEI